ncbi:MAG: bifunctional 2-polyprenyl-6-hydroxyphenol methylase/3-demethylubiquinol 3-O-methyltransferase UbiG [Gammaproteobacteria bacterium]|nr:MAG: bifunctional 2-polyprenyl-6-hydroxyphenol methylase/3-demethylubiquinol 3-O-methyltransferase UbiG [Gammaproteobacteria bacterium]
MNSEHFNTDAHEIAKFEAAAARWWDPSSEFKPLHDLNPLRLEYIESHVTLAGKRALDVGCGGGILAEGLARRGAEVTGIDMGAASLSAARLHLLESGLKVDYQQTAVEQFAQHHRAEFDLVTCMELLEHVPDPASVVRACAQLVKPGGVVFFSTLNRNPKSWLFAVLGAEYLLRMLPRGTHDYAKFIRPAELAAWIRDSGLTLRELTGMSYNPLSRQYSLSRDVSVNYFAVAGK